MLPADVTSVSIESFKELSAGKKIVVLYPITSFRNVFLSYFLNEAQDGLLYFRIPGEPEELTQWVSELRDELKLTTDSFGRNLDDCLGDEDSAEIGKALAADLGNLCLDRVVLCLDELDRAPQDADFMEFMRALVDSLPAKVQLVVNSRVLKREPWIQWVNSKEAVVLGAAHRSSNLIFTEESGQSPQLEVYAFGRGHAFSNGLEIERWDGALPRNLFFFLMDNSLVTRDQIFEIFWPKLSIKDATNVFHVTKRKISERISAYLEDGKNYELTRYSNGFYMPSNKFVRHYDVADFELAMEGALLSDNPNEKKILYGHAIELYKAPFLHTTNLPWVKARRRQLQLMYAEALVGMGHLRAEQGQWSAALGAYVRAVKEVPEREDIQRSAMKMYLNLGRPDDARKQYTTMERHLKRSLGIAPSKETRELFESITS